VPGVGAGINVGGAPAPGGNMRGAGGATKVAVGEGNGAAYAGAGG
jgi:hypothetical protein